MHHKLYKIASHLILISSLFFFAGCSSAEDNARLQIHDLTNIDLPSESTLIYNFNNEVFVGRVSRYAVFSFAERPLDFLTNNEFISVKSQDFQNEYNQDIESFSSFVIRETGKEIPEEYLVNWNDDYSWLLHPENIYFIYLEIPQNLIVYIVGH